MENTPYHWSRWSWSRWIFGRLFFVEISRTLWFITDYMGFKNILLVAFTVTENSEGHKIHRLVAGGLCVGWASHRNMADPFASQ